MSHSLYWPFNSPHSRLFTAARLNLRSKGGNGVRGASAILSFSLFTFHYIWQLIWDAAICAEVPGYLFAKCPGIPDPG